MHPNPSFLPEVATVILNYNGKDYLRQFLPSVLETNYPNHQIIVADNGSTDDSITFLKNEFPTVRIIELPENLGFAAGYNKAIECVNSDYLVLLNSDVEVTPNWLLPMITHLEQQPKLAAAQPKIRAFHQKEYFEHAGAAGGYIDRLIYPFCRGRIFETCEKDNGQYDTTQEIFWASGAAFVVKTALFKTFDGFDGGYFAHMEEIDLCWRMKRAGYGIAVVPESVVYHVGGGTLDYSSPNKVYLNFRNRLRTVFKNESTTTLIWLFPIILMIDGLAVFKFLLDGKFRSIWAIIRGHWSFFFSIFTWITKRKYYNKIIKNNRVGEPNNEGRYNRSVVWKYYVAGKKRFSQL